MARYTLTHTPDGTIAVDEQGCTYILEDHHDGAGRLLGKRWRYMGTDIPSLGDAVEVDAQPVGARGRRMPEGGLFPKVE